MSTTQHSPITRRVQGTDVPAAGAWVIDPGHADVAFVGRHFMLTKVRGRFTDVVGTVYVADDPAASRVDVTINMASVTSGSDDRDDHLRSADFFDVENHPEGTFRSDSVTWKGHTARVTGNLTLVGVSSPVVLDVQYLGSIVDPWGGQRAIYSASTEIDREDWGLTWNVALEAGGLLVSKKIRIELEVETVRAT
jgi:polyisoprenoid-binding protein YceI